jgi:SAM-dependent methyltransferase
MESKTNAIGRVANGYRAAPNLAAGSCGGTLARFPGKALMRLLFNFFYGLAGIAFLLLSKVKDALRGYRAPKPFTTAEWARSANYDITVADNWLRHLATYAAATSVVNKNVLELGPGSDLGTGLYLLSKQVSQYVAVDINNLVQNAPRELYDVLFDLIASRGGANTDSLRQELRLAQDGTGHRLRFVCSPNFDLASSVKSGSIDLVFSQAAFEHFEDFNRFVQDLDFVTRPGAILVAEVDLQAHSRWIRDKDPLSIYRYSDPFYTLLRCSGSPNRLRPYQYKAALERCGWKNVQIKPLTVLDEKHFAGVKNSLAKQFGGGHNEMEQLSIMLCATKAEPNLKLESNLK